MKTFKQFTEEHREQRRYVVASPREAKDQATLSEAAEASKEDPLKRQASSLTRQARELRKRYRIRRARARVVSTYTAWAKAKAELQKVLREEGDDDQIVEKALRRLEEELFESEDRR